MIEIHSREIVFVDPNDLIPNPKNNNKHPEKQIERLKKIIKRQGFRSPIEVSNRSGFIVCGHLRHQIAIELGMEKVPVMYQDFENEALEYAHLTADNEIARWAEFDRNLTLEMISDLEIEDIELLGVENFSLVDIEEIDDKDDSIVNDENKKWIIEAQFPNEMEMRDIHDDLLSRGYIVKVKGE